MLFLNWIIRQVPNSINNGLISVDEELLERLNQFTSLESQFEDFIGSNNEKILEYILPVVQVLRVPLVSALYFEIIELKESGKFAQGSSDSDNTWQQEVKFRIMNGVLADQTVRIHKSDDHVRLTWILPELIAHSNFNLNDWEQILENAKESIERESDVKIRGFGFEIAPSEELAILIYRKINGKDQYQKWYGLKSYFELA